MNIFKTLMIAGVSAIALSSAASAASHDYFEKPIVSYGEDANGKRYKIHTASKANGAGAIYGRQSGREGVEHDRGNPLFVSSGDGASGESASSESSTGGDCGSK